MAKHLGCDPLTVAMKVKSQAWNCENLEPVSPVRRVSGSSVVTELEGELTVPISDYSDLSAVVPRQHFATNNNSRETCTYSQNQPTTLQLRNISSVSYKIARFAAYLFIKIENM